MITAEITVLIMKIKATLIMISAIVLAFVAPIIPLIITVGLCMLLDTVFGIIRARKLKERITSRKLSKLVSKMVLYQTALITFFCIEKYIIGDFVLIFTSISLFLTKLVAATLAYIELKSIGENVEIITGKNYWLAFKELLSRTKSIKNEIEEVKENKGNTPENKENESTIHNNGNINQTQLPL